MNEEEVGTTWKEDVKRIFDEAVKQPLDKLTKPTGDTSFSHDRCDKTIQMRLYSMQKPQLALVVGIFLAINGFFFAIGFAGPPMTAKTAISAQHLTNSTDLLISNYNFKSPIVSPYCKKMWITAKLDLKPIISEIKFETKFNYSVEISGFADADKLFDSEMETKKQYQETKLICSSDKCDEVPIAHIGYFEYSRYKISLKFFGLENLARSYSITKLTFYFKSYHPIFSRFELWLRFIFVIATFAMSIWFYSSMQPYPSYMWSLEQTWIMCLSPMLVLFNNPIYPLVFLTNSSFPGILDTWFQLTFLASILLFWICIYRGIRQRVRRLINFYLPKLIIVLVIWLSAILTTSIRQQSSFKHLTYFSRDRDELGQQTLVVIFCVLGSIYGLYLTYMVVRSCKELRNMPFFDLRLKFFTLMMLSVIMVAFASLCAKYGIVIALQDSFVSELSNEPSSSAAFLSFFAIMNTYVAAMVYVYSPIPSAVKNSSDIPLVENDDSEDELYAGIDYQSAIKRQPDLHDNDDD